MKKGKEEKGKNSLLETENKSNSAVKQCKKLSKTQKKWIIVISSVVGTILLAGLSILIILIISGNEYIGPDGRIRYYYTQTVGENSTTINLTMPRILNPDPRSAPEGKGYITVRFGIGVIGSYVLDIDNFKILSTPNIEVDRDKTVEINNLFNTDGTVTISDQTCSFEIAFLVDEDFWDNDQDEKIILQADFAYFVYDNNAGD